MIPDPQPGVVELLLRRFGNLVPSDELAALYGATSRRNIDNVVYRLRARVARAGLQLGVVRQRGVILEPS